MLKYFPFMLKYQHKFEIKNDLKYVLKFRKWHGILYGCLLLSKPNKFLCFSKNISRQNTATVVCIASTAKINFREVSTDFSLYTGNICLEKRFWLFFKIVLKIFILSFADFSKICDQKYLKFLSPWKDYWSKIL